MRRFAIIPLSLAAISPLVAGCPHLDEASGAYCEETATVVSLDEETVLGFSPQQVLETLGGTHSVTLEYGEDGDSAGLTIELLHDGGEARYVESVAVYPDSGQEMDTAAVQCESRVDIDITTTFATDDGVFAESWELPLAATAGDAASFSLSDLQPADFQGSYDFMAFDPAEYDEVHTSVWAAFDMGGPRGYVSETAELTEDGGPDSAAMAENREIATWQSGEE
ncbi:MAG: hypothetical protein QGH45_11925 [Myxococcota bacterium]|jgi:hypothetical protein|nr:hypothetical protein [Myxococcota bacterium]